MWPKRSISLLPAPVSSGIASSCAASISSSETAITSSDTCSIEQTKIGIKMEPDLEDRPAKNEGYPAFCKYIASAENLFLIRRFNEFQTRVILAWQDEISQMEETLRDFDDDCRSGAKQLEDLGTFRDDPLVERIALLKKARASFKEYNDYVLSYSQIRARSSATESQTNNLTRWLEFNEGAIDHKEREFLKHGADLMPLVQRPASWLRQGLEGLGKRARIFKGDHKGNRGRSDQVIFLSTRGMSIVGTTMIVIFGLACLLGPMWWLNGVPDTTDRLKVISGWIVGFAIILGAATVDEPMQILVGTAAYAAVLMVFLQLGPKS